MVPLMNTTMRSRSQAGRRDHNQWVYEPMVFAAVQVAIAACSSEREYELGKHPARSCGDYEAAVGGQICDAQGQCV